MSASAEPPPSPPDALPPRDVRPGAALWAAAQFLFRGRLPESLAAPILPRHVIRWIVPLGIAIGLAWIGAFRAAWRLYGDPEYVHDRTLPALAVVALESLVTGRALLRGLGASMERPLRQDASSPLRPDALIVLPIAVFALYALIVSVPERVGWYPPAAQWRRYVNPFYPLVTYRPLLLAPIWGRWAILLAGCVGRTAASADPATRLLCAAIRPAVVLRWAVVPFVLTALYTLREGFMRQGVYCGLFVFLVAYLTALLLARRNGGQTADSLFGCAAVAQLAFLAAYRAMCVK